MSYDAAAPRISRGRAATTVIAGLVLTGVVIGVLWAWLAPAVHGVVALTKDGERVRAHLGAEADHFFVAAFLMVGMLSAMAVIAAALVWQWRAHRGPLMVVALALGAAAAAGVAAGVGAALVHWRYGAIDVGAAPISPDHRVHYVTEAPPVFFGHSPMLVALTLLFPAAIAALVYSLIAVSVARDDLGAWPPVEGDELDPPLTTGSVLPSGQ
jgi:hypothetical protein